MSTMNPDRCSVQKELNAVFSEGFSWIYTDEQFCDLVVVVSGTKFHCHRLILAMVSDFFRLSLTKAWLESASGVVKIDHEDVTPESFCLFLNIIYLNADFSKASAKSLLKMAIFLQVSFLQEACVRFLVTSAPPDQYINVLQLAKKYELKELATEMLKLLVVRLLDVAKNEDFLSLPQELLLFLLAEHVHRGGNHHVKDLFCAVMRWVEHDIDERKVHLAGLLQVINFLGVQCMDVTRLMAQHVSKDLTDLLCANWWLCHPDCSTGSISSNKPSAAARGTAAGLRCSVCHDVHTGCCCDRCVRKCVVIVGGCENARTLSPVSKTTALPLTSKKCDRISCSCMRNEFAYPRNLGDGTEEVDVGDSFATYTLQPLPENCGLHFASCVWCNRLYVSGGSLNPTFFAVYSPVRNEWETLPALPLSREKHVMEAVNWKIYVLGGEEDADLAQDTLVYNIKTRQWTNHGPLLKITPDICEITAAALGHRIYVFCGTEKGKKAENGKSGKGSDVDVMSFWTQMWGQEGYNLFFEDLVSDDGPQYLLYKVYCLDTRTRSVYVAGKFDEDTKGLTAVSDGGTVYLVDSEKIIYRMVEDTAKAEDFEDGLTESQNADEGNGCLGNGVDLDQGTTDLDDWIMDDSAADTVLTSAAAADDDGNKVPEELSTVSFCPFEDGGQFRHRVHHGGYYRHKGELLMCGGIDEDDSEISSAIESLTLLAGSHREKQQTLQCGRAYFGLHTLLVPNLVLQQEEELSEATFRFAIIPECFSQEWDDGFAMELKTPPVTVKKMQWYISVEGEPSDYSGQIPVSIYLNNLTMQTEAKRQSKLKTQRQTFVRVKFQCRVVPDRFPLAQDFEDDLFGWHSIDLIFSFLGGAYPVFGDSDEDDHEDESRYSQGWDYLFDLSEFKRDFDGMHGNKVMLEFKVTAEEPQHIPLLPS